MPDKALYSKIIALRNEYNELRLLGCNNNQE